MTKDIVLTIVASGILLMLFIWFLTDPRSQEERARFFFQKRRFGTYIGAFCFISLYLFITLSFEWSWLNLPWIKAGLVLYLAGIFLAIWAKLAMKFSWGPPAQHDTKRQTELITEWPFSLTRNPIYVGILAMFVGFSLAMQSLSILMTPLIFLVVHRVIQKEEHILEAHFGEEYKKYKKKVPRYL